MKLEEKLITYEKKEKATKGKKIAGKLGYYVSKEVASFAAPIMAISSAAGYKPGIWDNIIAAAYVPIKFGEFVLAYVRDTGVRTFVNSNVADTFEVAKSIGRSIVERPLETIVAAGIVYFGTKYLPHTLKYVKDKIGGGKK